MLRFEQPELIGGGSSINGQVANRGTPDDYEEWSALGARGWDWKGVLPFFMKLERDLDFAGPMHGTSGPIPITRIPRSKWPDYSIKLVEALSTMGHKDIADQNAAFGDGWFAQSLSNDGKHRVSSSMAYLNAEVRRRPNLAIITDTKVHRLLMDGARCTGAEVLRDGAAVALHGREIIVTAGALHTPAILLRAGIGAEAELRKLGVSVVADRPGVGANLQEHPGVSLSGYVRSSARLNRSTTTRHNHFGLRFSSNFEGSVPSASSTNPPRWMAARRCRRSGTSCCRWPGRASLRRWPLPPQPVGLICSLPAPCCSRPTNGRCPSASRRWSARFKPAGTS